MILSIEAANASWSEGKLSLAFDVIPEDHYHLELKTGEIFQDRGYAALRGQKDKQISATLFVEPMQQNPAGAELPSEMRYHSTSGERGAEIWLIWRLADDELMNFHSIILSGKIPSRATIWFGVHNELEFGWEPDGSGQKWDNEKHPVIVIEKVTFNFSLRQRPTKIDLIAEIPDGYDAEFFGDITRVNFALARKLSLLDSRLERTNWFLGFIVGIIRLT